MKKFCPCIKVDVFKSAQPVKAECVGSKNIILVGVVEIEKIKQRQIPALVVAEYFMQEPVEIAHELRVDGFIKFIVDDCFLQGTINIFLDSGFGAFLQGVVHVDVYFGSTYTTLVPVEKGKIDGGSDTGQIVHITALLVILGV